MRYGLENKCKTEYLGRNIGLLIKRRLGNTKTGIVTLFHDAANYVVSRITSVIHVTEVRSVTRLHEIAICFIATEKGL